MGGDTPALQKEDPSPEGVLSGSGLHSQGHNCFQKLLKTTSLLLALSRDKQRPWSLRLDIPWV